MLDVEFAQLSDTGTVRPRNEDYLGYVSPPLRRKSALTAGCLRWPTELADSGRAKSPRGPRWKRCLPVSAGRLPWSPTVHLLTRLVQAANARICETEALAGPAGAGMSSTIVVCALRFDRATIAHVGDSRCYLIRNAKARAITHDHTVANEQVRLGILSKAEAEDRHPRATS